MFIVVLLNILDTAFHTMLTLIIPRYHFTPAFSRTHQDSKQGTHSINTTTLSVFSALYSSQKLGENFKIPNHWLWHKLKIYTVSMLGTESIAKLFNKRQCLIRECLLYKHRNEIFGVYTIITDGPEHKRSELCRNYIISQPNFICVSPPYKS